MRYINLRFTYLLTYLLTYVCVAECECGDYYASTVALAVLFAICVVVIIILLLLLLLPQHVERRSYYYHVYLSSVFHVQNVFLSEECKIETYFV